MHIGLSDKVDPTDGPDLEAEARDAWRRADRCVGRAGWSSLVVRDARRLTTGAQVSADLVRHLVEATNCGSVRPTLTVLHTDVRILNEQLVRYADDPRYSGFASSARRAGWQPHGQTFEVLPLVIMDAEGAVGLYSIPAEAVLEVEIDHPSLSWFSSLGLRWHAVPAISNMLLRLGDGSVHPVVFNGWYVSDEISARNLAGPDRYNVLPAVIEHLAGARSRNSRRYPWWEATEGEYWERRALVEVEAAVLWSFRRAGVKISSPAQEARRFVDHVRRESVAARTVPTEWSWVISPITPVLLPTYHRYYDPPEPGIGPELIVDPVLAGIGRDGWHTDHGAPVPRTVCDRARPDLAGGALGLCAGGSADLAGHRPAGRS